MLACNNIVHHRAEANKVLRGEFWQFVFAALDVIVPVAELAGKLGLNQTGAGVRQLGRVASEGAPAEITGFSFPLTAESMVQFCNYWKSTRSA